MLKLGARLLGRRGKAIVAILTLVAASSLAVLVAFDGAVMSLLNGISFRNVGTVKAVGVGVYWDSGCNSTVSSIDWGVVEPGSAKNTTIYIRNEGNTPETLSFETDNWNPSNATEYMVLSWDYGGQSINVGEVVQVTFTLSVSASIVGITSFSFDITIVGSG